MVWAGRVWEPPKLADHCRACGQPFAEHEASGRALYPVVIPLVALLVFSALRVDDIWRLPLWVYPLVWGPASALLVGLAVRATRAAVLAARVPARMQGQEQGKAAMMRRLPIVPTVIVLLAVAMIGLGFWQLRARAEEHLLARYAAALTDPAPVVFPVAGDGTAVLYRRAAFDCRVEPGLWDSVAGRNAAGEGAMSTSPIAWRRTACLRWSSLAGRAIRTRRNGMAAG
jgi:uncharacterized protein (DUF983 family)